MACGPYRRGRGGQSEETRQLESELLANDNGLAKCANANESAIDALTVRVAALEGGGTATVTEYIHFGFDTGSTLVYLPVAGGNSATASIGEGWQNWLAPYACTVEDVVLTITSGSNYGTTVVGSHIDGNTTAEDTDTQTLDSGTAATFTLGTAVSAGEYLAVSFDGQFAGGEVTGYVRLTR